MSDAHSQVDRSFPENIAIEASHLSKCYRIYEKPSHRLYQMLAVGGKQFYREFWALRDVSLSIRRGETVGIIGRNGSGKSTFLQLVCRTLEPTSGTIESQGRIAALLELGLGFNPEFTGRDNVFLSASLYGLTSDEIAARFDDIAAFADIGDFIDQPVKTYSSGMYVRLAFAVIAHVNADILIIDEALAVGDAVFTQKCMRFLRKFRETGTLLFVSHDMAAVLNLCQTAVWLEHGTVRMTGSATEVTRAYSKDCLQADYGSGAILKDVTASLQIPGTGATSTESLGVAEDAMVDNAAVSQMLDSAARETNPDGFGTGVAEITEISLVDQNGEPVSVLRGGETLTLRIRARAFAPVANVIIGFFVKDRLGQSLFGDNTYSHVPSPFGLKACEMAEASFHFQLPLLPNGDYVITAAIAEGDPHDHVQHHWIHEAFVFRVSSKQLRYGLVGIPFESVEMLKL
jgi:lipopolysaccharide transport system ATP-binding protein